MCFEMVSNDFKKVQALSKQTICGIVHTKANESKNPYVICNYIWHMRMSELWANAGALYPDIITETIDPLSLFLVTDGNDHYFNRYKYLKFQVMFATVGTGFGRGDHWWQLSFSASILFFYYEM